MNAFMDHDFLLTTETAKRLYHEVAEKAPILDYHCHINPGEIAGDHSFDNITQAWLGGDHYKWRLMRSNGVDERFITGDAPDREKFEAYAEALPRAIGNPLYHWTHLELQAYFGYRGALSGKTAEAVWDLCNEKLRGGLSVREIIRQSGVTLICTTDDPVDSLDAHRAIRADGSFQTKVLPAWRPDKAVNIGKPGFTDYIKKLSEVSEFTITSFSDVCAALSARMDVFGELGCTASDHGLDNVPFAPAPAETVDSVFKAALCGTVPDVDQTAIYQFALLTFLAKEYAKRGWVMQLHYGTARNTNSVMFDRLGPDTGFDCISPLPSADGLPQFLDALFSEGALPKTILYSLNPNDNAYLGTAIGCFQGTEAAGKLQHGAAWWFNDTRDGMAAQLKNLANLSVLGNFVGMLTDSRSFLSYTRHGYFRRILCELLGGWVENGEYPNDWDTLETLVRDICYNNAVRYFNFPLPLWEG